MIIADAATGPGGVAVNLSLISHTNVGKTTLARTLLGEDVGEVRDAAHVTDTASGHALVTAGPHALMLWDTPGFGDTARLLKRLRHAGNPIGWFLTQVWDRFRERALWSSQQAVRNAREAADVILYLVNAAERPANAPYVALEMEVLAWIGKPILVLLNQIGPPGAETEAEIAAWERHLADYAAVAGVLPLDAFARCWVQEGVLLARVADLLPPDKAPAMRALEAAWAARARDRFDAAMAVLAEPLAAALTDREPLGEKRWRDQLADALKGGGLGEAEARAAMAKLAERLAAGTAASTQELIALHGLSGTAGREVLRRLERDYQAQAPAREGFATMLGGILSGAVGGLAADIAAGGLTLGGGMIVGGVLGAVGAGTLARGYNLVRGEDGTGVRWSADFAPELIASALVRYLAVAHFGRGRGAWEEGEHPALWRTLAANAVAEHSASLGAIHAAVRRGADAAALTEPVRRLLAHLAQRMLVTLYPDAVGVFERDPPPLATLTSAEMPSGMIDGS